MKKLIKDRNHIIIIIIIIILFSKKFKRYIAFLISGPTQSNAISVLVPLHTVVGQLHVYTHILTLKSMFLFISVQKLPLMNPL